MKKLSSVRIIKEVFINQITSTPYLRVLLLPILFSVIVAAFTEVTSNDYLRKISECIENEERLKYNVKMFFLTLFIASTFTEMNGYVFTGVLQHIYRSVARSTFLYFLSMEPKKFNTVGSGEIQISIERRGRGAYEIIELLVLYLIPIFITLCFSIASIFITLGLTSCLIVMGSISLYIYFTICIAIYRSKIRRKLINAENATNNKLQDSLSNHEVILSYRTLDVEVADFDSTLKVQEKRANTLWRGMYVLNLIQKWIFTFQICIIIYLGINNHLDQKMSPALLTYFVSISKTLSSNLGNLGFIYSRYTQALVNIRSTYDLKDKKAIESKVEKGSMDRCIAFDGVSFSYENKKILDNINFELSKGEKVAIIGKNGAGKSTFMKLILGFEKYSGTIKIDDTDIRELSDDSFKKIISHIPQNSCLFDNTVKYNIKYGTKVEDDTKIYDLSKTFNVYNSFSTLEHGFNTNVGERGKFLSGGERQKVLIMRALLKESDILLMDEPTAALDKESESYILQNIFKNNEDTTVFMILHNLELLHYFDKVLFLDNKKIKIYEGRQNILYNQDKVLTEFIKGQ